jgi:hypothetical protein
MSQLSAARRPFRRAALLMALAGSLAIPVAGVSADSGGPPDGSGRNVFLASDGTSVTFHEDGGPFSLCVETATELGCAEGSGGLTTTAGFVTGLNGVTVTVNDASGATRDVTVSFSLTFAGAIVPSTEVIDGSDETCQITWTVKERTVPVKGTVSYDGVAYPVGADATSKIRSLKEQVRC